MAAVFFICHKRQMYISEMEENNALSIGQRTIVDGYLRPFEPSDSYEPTECTIMDSESIVLELNHMCDLDCTALADYLASLGFKVYADINDSSIGWILKEKTTK